MKRVTGLELNEADRIVMTRIILERALAGEEAGWEELTSGLDVGGPAPCRPSMKRVYRKDRDAAMTEAAEEICMVAERYVESA